VKTFGYLLLIAGFLAGAFATALDVEETNWALFWPAAVVAIAGLATIKRQASSHARSEAVLTANRSELSESLGNVVRTLDALKDDASFDSAALRAAIDDRLRPDLQRFVVARESIVHLVSLTAYANIMSEFAAGERYVNRVWSSSADGYEEEASRYLERAAAQFRRAHAELEEAGLT